MTMKPDCDKFTSVAIPHGHIEHLVDTVGWRAAETILNCAIDDVWTGRAARYLGFRRVAGVELRAVLVTGWAVGELARAFVPTSWLDLTWAELASAPLTEELVMEVGGLWANEALIEVEMALAVRAEQLEDMLRYAWMPEAGAYRDVIFLIDESLSAGVLLESSFPSCGVVEVA